jgi:hypothetical protein
MTRVRRGKVQKALPLRIDFARHRQHAKQAFRQTPPPYLRQARIFGGGKILACENCRLEQEEYELSLLKPETAEAKHFP